MAVLLVLLAHLGVPGFPGGGLVGVQLFFALSGYLITGIMLRELDGTSTIDLTRFWLRRVRRLYPALIVVCAAFVALAGITGKPAGAVHDAGIALIYAMNLDWTARLGWLRHTWSLAVEEQFYVVWPLLLVCAHRLGRMGIGLVAVGLALATILARHMEGFGELVLYDLLRWDALLIGCALAAWRVRLGVSWLVPAALVFGYYAEAPFTFDPWSFTLTSLAAGVLVASAASLPVLVAVWLRYFGRISYGLYLWSCLLLHAIPWWAALPLSVLAADISFRFIERRFLPRPNDTLALALAA